MRSAELILQRALEEEVNDHLHRYWYERFGETTVKSGYRNGYYPRKIKTTEGKMSIDVPRVRDSEQPFSSGLLGRIAGIENNLKRLAAEMYAVGYPPET